MFKNLSDRLSKTLNKIHSKGRLTEDNIKNTICEVREALLEADVALAVVQDFISKIKESALGQKINKSLTPGQEFIKIVRDELINVMGKKNHALNIVTNPPAIILVAGLQGSGKTTSVGKMGRYLREKKKKKVLMVSADIYRPAAIKQLEYLAEKTGVDFFSYSGSKKPLDIVNNALNHARIKFYDVLLVDTAGCLHIDEIMMKEIIAIHTFLKPIETLFVVDAMTGQNAANIAISFNKLLKFTGIILTKMDGDSRGGAALSVQYITGKPIKFIGVGEDTDALELFYPERLARRILGMGDMLSFIEHLESKVDYTRKENIIDNFKKGSDFNIIDFLNQIKQMRNMGGMVTLMSKLPQIKMQENIKSYIDDKVLMSMEAIINSMTIEEKYSPSIIKGSRKRRIASGSGTRIQDVNLLLKQFHDMQCVMKKIKKSGIAKVIHNIKSMMPPSF